MKKRYKGAFSCRKHIGKVRITQDDQCGALANSEGDVILVVCDGMGGQNKGDFASKMAIDSILQSFTDQAKVSKVFLRRWLNRVYQRANSTIFDEASRNPLYKDMGTTCVCVYIHGDKLYIANAGDSRAYLLTREGLKMLTEDQTYVEFLYRTGKITEAEKKTRDDRHMLMNALGVYPSCSVDISVHPYHGEPILLCSDGLYNNASNAEIRTVLSTDDRVDEKTQALIDLANANGGSDNIAVVLWESFR